jgi:hypothetical protein
MTLIISPRKALNKAYLKSKPLRSNIESFKENLIKLLEQINHAESEEFNKNVLSDFLKKTYYDPDYFINTKGSNDQVIHNGKTAIDSVGVIIEAKRASNPEMLKQDNINTKAMQELVLYYLRERITHKNLEVKHLIATSVKEWFIFDSNEFEKHFAQNKKLIKQFEDFEAKVLSGIKTEFFYKEIARNAIDEVKDSIEFTYINISDFEAALKNSDKGDDAKLIPLYKILSPQHLLKAAFANDSNTLNKSFYTELLHIIGLEETKDGSKKLIGRKKEGERDSGTLIESAIVEIESLDRLSRLKNRKQYGETKDEQLFNIAIELAITWINRILFLKLLEAQLVTYHKNNASYKFLNIETVKDFDELNTLFFQVLAIKTNDRNSNVKTKFAKVPYLNSSLFEPAEIEQNMLFVSMLNGDNKIRILPSTVLTNQQGKKITGQLNAVEYLFAFLNAYDFASDGSEEIQEDNKTLINASVLGLIFEKINGYKDGSFFTPGFITMYMSKEAIRKSVIQKFNDVKKWTCTSFEDLYNKIEDSAEANRIINSLKICDPAVGSGHFLVSALNELIAVKAELKILQDKTGKRLKEYTVEVVNDELIVSDEDGQIVDYNPKSSESQRVQETLFNEKQTIIENCLFGVDINPNSVKICRLRLWIELLKNAYYKEDGELETLPNIDINIKCGNSLISRFDLDIDLKDALKKSKLKIPEYKAAVQSYRNAKSKDEKWAMDSLIKEVKSGFQSEILSNDKRVLDLYKYKNELNALLNQQSLFELDKKAAKLKKEKISKLEADIYKLEQTLEEIRSNKIYENAFEWRFEFPEVLNDSGEYVGFDVIIGNPPYGASLTDSDKKYLYDAYKYQDYQLDTYLLFIERSYQLIKQNATLSYIIPNSWLTNLRFINIRTFVFNSFYIDQIAVYKKAVFEEAVVDTLAIFMRKKSEENNNICIKNYLTNTTYQSFIASQNNWISSGGNTVNILMDKSTAILKNKIEHNAKLLGDMFNLVVGLKPYQTGKGKPKQTADIVKNRTFDSVYKIDNTYRKLLRGSDIQQYKINWDGKRWIKYGEWLAEPRYTANFDANEKIVVRQTGDTLIAALDNEQFVCMNNLHVISNHIDSNHNLKYLLALLNSKLLDFYHSLLNPEKGEALAEVKKENIARLPIKFSDKSTQDSIVDIVNKLTSKDVNSVDEKLLIAKLNLLIYKIYDIDADSIELIQTY